MTGEMLDYPTKLRVDSESESGDSYGVDLTAYPLGEDHRGVMQYNGSCTCSSFIYRHEPALKKPENKGKVFKCKHIAWGRQFVLDFLLHELDKADPNKETK